ncbi:MAG: excisionase family DNA-binding protein [Verrucomicrobiales bacterium]|nr:excisionase family DNA-binding protein [Verrucomicrobiales bacterium]
MYQVSTELLKIAGRLEGGGMDDLASRLVALAEKVSENDRLLTVAEAAKWLGCGRRTLDQLIVERRIPAHLIGGRYRLDKDQVLKETRLGRLN